VNYIIFFYTVKRIRMAIFYSEKNTLHFKYLNIHPLQMYKILRYYLQHLSVEIEDKTRVRCLYQYITSDQSTERGLTCCITSGHQP